jgi:plastocyanin
VKRRLIALGLAALGALAAAGCSVWGPEGGPGGSGIPAPTQTEAAPVLATMGADGVQRVEITVGDDLRFQPSFVQARPGEVEFVFRNAGATAHNVRVSPGDQTTGNMGEGAVATVRISVDRPGRYPYPCLYHVSSGMTGTLEIL